MQYPLGFGSEGRITWKSGMQKHYIPLFLGFWVFKVYVLLYKFKKLPIIRMVRLNVAADLQTEAENEF